MNWDPFFATIANYILYISITQNGGGFLRLNTWTRGKKKNFEIFPNILMLNFATTLTVLLLSDDNRVNQGLGIKQIGLKMFEELNIF